MSKPTLTSLLALIAALAAATPAAAGSISGTIRDAGTSAPLAGIDLDIFDASWIKVSGVNASSDAAGAYTLGPLVAGEYFVRADPGVGDGYVDSYYPGVWLKSLAATISVPATGDVIVDFALDPGAVISGSITDAYGIPVLGVDIDAYAWDGSYVSSVNAATDSTGKYTIGCFPAGNIFIRADPDPALLLQVRYWNDKPNLSLANPVTVGATDVGGIDFALPGAGILSGVVMDQISGLGLFHIDLDLFDVNGAFLVDFNAKTDSTGAYTLGNLPPGTYYLEADPTPAQGYIDLFYGGTMDILTAAPIVVTAGAVTGGRDIQLSRGGTIGGTVTSSVTGLPVFGVRLTLFDMAGSILSSAGASTLADGSFLVGAVPTGYYVLRCGGDVTSGLAFEFYPGVTLRSEAQLIGVQSGASTTGIDFTLDPGGWISGTVRASDTQLGLAGVDMDVYGLNGEFVGALDAKTSGPGTFLLGPVPVGDFRLKADPSATLPYMPQYFDHVHYSEYATPVSSAAGITTGGIDFDVLPVGGVDAGPVSPGTDLALAIHPNPFNPKTQISFTLTSSASVRLELFDASGRRVRRLLDEPRSEGQYAVDWDGRDDDGNVLPSGLYLARVQAGAAQGSIKLLMLR